LTNQGYSDDAAYEEMILKYKDYMEEKKHSLRIVNNLKVSNGFRSLLDVYQQRAEYESRLKVSRMDRDLQIKEFLAKNEMPEFDRHVKIVNKAADGSQKRDSEGQTFDEFFSRSRRLLDMYYKNTYMKDQLESLTDKELLHTIRETPTQIKKQCKEILILLEKNNVTVNEDGSLDLSKCTNDIVKKKLENNPMVQYALMQRDLDYGFSHLEHRKKATEDIRRDIMIMRSQDIKKEEEDTREQRELEMRMQISQSEIDKVLNFTTAGGSSRKLEDDSRGDRHLNPANLIDGTQYRLDKNSAMLESFPERLLRLEKNWFYQRGRKSGTIDELTEEELEKKLEEISHKMRRVKIQIERQALGEAQERLFNEHNQLTFDELLTEQVPIERLLNYYQLPIDQRQPGLIEDNDFNTIKGLVRRKELVEDLVSPFEHSYRTQLTAEDTMQKKLIEQKREMNQRVSQDLQDKDLLVESLVDHSEQSLDEASVHKQRFLKAKQAKLEKKTASVSSQLAAKERFGESVRKSLGLGGDHEEDFGPDEADNVGLKSKRKLASISPKAKGKEKKEKKGR
jgi:hypothetical protein